MTMESLVGGTRRLAFAVALGVWLTPQVEAQQPTAQAEGEATLEHVMDAIEGLPAETQEEVMDLYERTAQSLFSHYQNRACLALRLAQWRQDNPEQPFRGIRGVLGLRVDPEKEREWYKACALDREDIAVNVAARARGMMNQSPRQRSEDQIERITTCAGEKVADRYLEDPNHNSRVVSNRFLEAMRECRQLHR